MARLKLLPYQKPACKLIRILIPFLVFIYLIPDAKAENYFNYGVASGDPLQNKVIIWTKIESTEAVAKVFYEVSKDDGFQKIVNTGEITTDKSKDYTIKADVDSLKPDTYYYYRFKYKDSYSPTGRTRTLPEETNKFKLAVVSCQNFSTGYFNPYKHIIHDNPDVIIMLGDYIYENPRKYDPSPRFDTSGTANDIETYRAKYRYYLTDPFLLEARAKIPFITVWDDHEVTNDYSGVPMKISNPKRLNDAYRVYFEYVPLREQEENKIYRSFKIGSLIDLFMTDGRQYRDEKACGNSPSLNPQCIFNSYKEGPTYLGKNQKEWLINSISSSGAQWQVWGNNTVFMDMRFFSIPINYDQWDGFYFEKEEILKSIINKKERNLVIVTGDLHSFVFGDVMYGSKKVASEVVTTAISSRTYDLIRGYQWFVPQIVPHIKYLNADYRGYSLLDFNRRKTDVYLYGVTSVFQPESEKILLKHFEIKRKNHYAF